ncbi:hypothetical protein [Spirillospora sp. CA-294931]|uniref:hypothetical protein n=1 Tax=Spirillospora sp. CA-294931 TaxID=3240042 RepID=UPI003D92A7F5
MTTLRPDKLALIAAATIAISACNGDKAAEPTVSEAEQTLKQHITALAGPGVGNMRNVKIIDHGGKSVHCANGKAKRTYAVVGDKRDRTDRSPTDLSGILLGLLVTQVAKYDLTHSNGGDARISVHHKTARTNLTINSSSRGVVGIYGVTDCLRVH